MALFGRESETTKPAAAVSAPTPPAPAPAPRPQPPAPAPPRTAPPPAASVTRASATPTHIGTGARLQGEIGGDTDVVIEGRVEGRVRPERDVTVAEGGSVQGSIEARRVRVAGRVEGDVRGREVVEIQPTGRLVGDVVAPNMVIADGAFFKGSVEMGGGVPPAGEGAARAGGERAAR